MTRSTNSTPFSRPQIRGRDALRTESEKKLKERQLPSGMRPSPDEPPSETANKKTVNILSILHKIVVNFVDWISPFPLWIILHQHISQKMRLNRRVVRNSLSEMELARGKMLSHQLGVQAMPVKLRIDVLRVPEPAKRYGDYFKPTLQRDAWKLLGHSKYQIRYTSNTKTNWIFQSRQT